MGGDPAEYEAMGADFSNRGAHCEEQMALLNRLWTEETVDFEGRWHKISGAGINPLPTQEPIPMWIGPSSVPPSVSVTGSARWLTAGLCWPHRKTIPRSATIFTAPPRTSAVIPRKLAPKRVSR